MDDLAWVHHVLPMTGGFPRLAATGYPSTDCLHHHPWRSMRLSPWRSGAPLRDGRAATPRPGVAGGGPGRVSVDVLFDWMTEVQ